MYLLIDVDEFDGSVVLCSMHIWRSYLHDDFLKRRKSPWVYCMPTS